MNIIRRIKEWNIILRIVFKRKLQFYFTLEDDECYLLLDAWGNYSIVMSLNCSYPLTSFLHEMGHLWDFRKEKALERCTSPEQQCLEEIVASRYAVKVLKSLGFYKKEYREALLNWYREYAMFTEDMIYWSSLGEKRISV